MSPHRQNHRQTDHPDDYAVRLWAFETGDTALDTESATDHIPLAGSRFLDDALDFIDEGYTIFDKDLIL